MFRLTLLLTVSSLSVFAAPSACTSQTLADYFGLPVEGCRLGSRVLSAFTPVAGLPGASVIDPASIAVTPSVAGMDGNLLLTYNAAAANPDILESLFTLKVESDSPAGEMVRIVLFGAAATGDAVVSGLTELCNGSYSGTPVCSGATQSDVALATAGLNVPALAATLGIQSFEMLHDLTVDGATAGSASITATQLTFTTIPEPATVSLTMLALGAALLARRRTPIK